MFPVSIYDVSGESMDPSLKDGSKVLACKIAYLLSNPKPGHIVVFNHPREKNKLLIKRVNKIHREGLYVLGDNLRKSIDSRHFGYIAKKDLIAKVFYKI